MVNHLELLGISVKEKKYPDHYDYKSSDIKEISKLVTSLGKNTAVITTSKDAVKLLPLLKELKASLHVFEIPITVSFLFDEEAKFNKLISSHVKRN